MVMDSERAVCEQTHQQYLLEESHLSHLQEQLDLAEQQAQDALKEVIAFFLSSMHLGNFYFVWFIYLFVCVLEINNLLFI